MPQCFFWGCWGQAEEDKGSRDRDEGREQWEGGLLVNRIPRRKCRRGSEAWLTNQVRPCPLLHGQGNRKKAGSNLP